MDPFKDWEDMMKRMSRGFGEFPGNKRFSEFQSPEIDIVERDDEITVIAELPGVEKEDISINAEPTYLEIKADSKRGRKEEKEGYYYRERSSKSYRRHVSLPEEVNPKKANANYKNGILEVTLPKRHSKDEGTDIKIN